MSTHDADAARRDVAAFGAMVGVPLAEWQAQDLELDAPIVCLLWGRQMGKSRAIALRSLHVAFGAPQRRVLIVSGGGELGARRLLREVRGILEGSPLLRGSSVDEAATTVQLSNASEVRCVAASEGAVRGWQVDLLVLDEAQMLGADLVFSAALPTTAARAGARVVLAGTASGASGPFFDLWRRAEVGDEHVRGSRRVSRLVGGDDAAPWQTASMVEAQVSAMGSLRADAEHRCRWVSEAGALFSRAALERVTGDYLPDRLGEMTGPARVFAGQDWGAVHDRSAFVAIGRLPGEQTRFAVRCAHLWPAGAPLHEVVGDVACSPAAFDVFSIERNGLGEMASEALVRRLRERSVQAGGGTRDSRVVMVDAHDVDAYVARDRRAVNVPGGAPFVTRKLPVFVTAQVKQAMYASLRWLVERELLLLPQSATDLLRELALLRVDLSPQGAERVEAASGAHDDLADALALALGPFRDRRDGRWRTLIGYYADDRQRLPSPAITVDNVDVATVATGGGLQVPRLPTWVSVRGAQVTVPDGVDLGSPDRLSPQLAALRERVSPAEPSDNHHDQ